MPNETNNDSILALNLVIGFSIVMLLMLLDAVRRNAICANATNTDIDKVIRSWIKNAADRQGGRTNRKSK